jgi:hypothetical protein
VNRFAARVLVSGALATISSALAAVATSRLENGHAARPLNAIAHIYDGGPPRAASGPRNRNTALGLALHTAASLWWALLFEGVFGTRARRSVAGAATCGAAVSTTAYVVDYYVVSPRFRPGFEAYLSSRAMLAVYSALALGFAIAASATRRR